MLSAPAAPRFMSRRRVSGSLSIIRGTVKIFKE